MKLVEVHKIQILIRLDKLAMRQKSHFTTNLIFKGKWHFRVNVSLNLCWFMQSEIIANCFFNYPPVNASSMKNIFQHWNWCSINDTLQVEEKFACLCCLMRHWLIIETEMRIHIPVACFLIMNVLIELWINS